MVNPFHVFYWLCPGPSEESLSMTAVTVQNVCERTAVEILNDSLICGLCNRCYVCRHEDNMNNLVHPYQSSWVTRCIVNGQQYHERNFFFSPAVSLSSRLKIFSNPCCEQMCCHLGFIEHRQNGFSIILTGPRIFRMLIEQWLQF